MTVSTRSWTFRIRNGQYEGAIAMSSRAGAADSPLELVFGASYLEMDI